MVVEIEHGVEKDMLCSSMLTHFTLSAPDCSGISAVAQKCASEAPCSELNFVPGASPSAVANVPPGVLPEPIWSRMNAY